MLVIVLLCASCGNVRSASDTASGDSTGISKGSSSFSLADKREIQPTRKPAISFYEQYFPCDRDMQAEYWADVSPAERMLVHGYEQLDENGDSYEKPYYIRPIQTLANMILKYYFIHDRMPSSTEDLWQFYLEYFGEAYAEQGVTEEDFRKAFIKTITSPVTGEPVEWNHQEFSRGNAFITVLNDNPEALALAESDWSELWENRVKVPVDSESPCKHDGLGKRIHIYMRVYGETGVLDNSDISAQWSSDQMS